MTEKTSNVLLLAGGVLVGALVGASAALLTAPQSGLQTRTLLRNKSVELKDKMVVGASETRDRAGKAYDEAKSRTGKVLVDAKSRAGEMVQTMRQKMTKQEASLELAGAATE